MAPKEGILQAEKGTTGTAGMTKVRAMAWQI